MKKLIVAALAVSGAAIAYAHADNAEGKGRDGGFRSEMRELIRGEGMDVAALANLMQERSQARFAGLDADSDGAVTREEFLAATDKRAEARFERMKPDENGIVKREGKGRHHHHDGRRAERERPSEEEQAKHITERAAREFARLDTDKDGMISPQEHEAGLKARAERMVEHREKRAERREQRAERRGDMPQEMRQAHGELRKLMREGMNFEAYASFMQERATARFDALDADKDGKLTSAEFTAGIADRAEKLFARMDTNDDGKVTREDRAHRGGWHHGPRR